MISAKILFLTMAIIGLAHAAVLDPESRPANIPSFSDFGVDFVRGDNDSPSFNIPDFTFDPSKYSSSKVKGLLESPSFNIPDFNFDPSKFGSSKVKGRFVGGDWMCRSNLPFLTRRCQTVFCANGANIGGYCENGQCICITKNDLIPPTTTTTTAATPTTVV